MPRSVLDESYDPIYDQVRGILGEHFENYCFIVMNEEGQIFFDYNHLPAGKMLINEMQYEIRDDNLDIEWEFDGDLDDLEENLKLATQLGFEGMLLLHPKEIDLVHKYFTPSEKELREAKDIIGLSKNSGKTGRGVDIVNGKFVGPPLVRGAEKIVNKAEEIEKWEKK